MKFIRKLALSLSVLLSTLLGNLAHSEGTTVTATTIKVDWNTTIGTSKTTASVAMIPYPLLRRRSPIYEAAWDSLKGLNPRYARYVTWYVYPRLAVAELEPPSPTKTSWDFSLIDPEMVKFLETTQGREPIVNFSTIPAWMFKTEKPVTYPDDPERISDDYEQGTELVDPSGKQLGDYYGRIVSWYTKGGFTDENGKYHYSGHHYEIPWWGVLNEVQSEHSMTPQQYVARYDAIVAAIHAVSPNTKFVGPALVPMDLRLRISAEEEPAAKAPATQLQFPQFIEYFLDPRNHRLGIPIDMLSYHFYASPSATQQIDSWQYSFFDQADGFLNIVRFVETMRNRLSPKTQVNLDELGILLAEDWGKTWEEVSAHKDVPIPESYWNLYGAYYAYLYVELAKIGVDVATLSEFLNYPGNQRSCSLLNWDTGRPRASLRVLKLLIDNFGPGDQLVATGYRQLPVPDVAVQAFITRAGKKLLAVNKRMTPAELDLRAVGTAFAIDVVDIRTGEDPPRSEKPNAATLHLGPFAVAVVSIR